MPQLFIVALGWLLALLFGTREADDVAVIFGRRSRVGCSTFRRLLVQMRSPRLDHHHPLIPLQLLGLVLLERAPFLVELRIGNRRALASLGKQNIVELLGVCAVDGMDG